MLVPYNVKSLDEVDEALHSAYTKGDDGTYTANVPGSVSKTVLENEKKDRRKAENALKEATASLELFKDTDLDEVAKIRKQNAELLDSKGKLSLEQLSDEDRATFREEEFARLNQEHKNEMERTSKTLTGERDDYKTRLEATQAKMITSARAATVAELFEKRIRPEFMEDARLRADGSLVWSEEEGAFFDADNNSAEVWATNLLETRKVWLPESQNGGARGGGGNEVTGSERERAYAKAEEQGDYAAMALNSPVSE